MACMMQLTLGDQVSKGCCQKCESESVSGANLNRASTAPAELLLRANRANIAVTLAPRHPHAQLPRCQ